MMQTPIKPGKKWFVVGALLIALGVGGGVALGIGGFASVTRTVDHFARFDVKGGGTIATLRMPKGGEYFVYYERRGSNTLSSADIPKGLDVTMAGPDGRQVPFVLDRRERSFSVNDRTGISVGRLTIPTAGSYKLTAKAAGPDTFTLAVGKGVNARLVGYVLGGLAIAIVGFGLGLAVLIVTGVKRGRRKRELATAPVGGYAPIPSPWSSDTAPPPSGPSAWSSGPPTWDAAPTAPPAWTTPGPPPPAPPPGPLPADSGPAPSGPAAPWAAPHESEPASPAPWSPPIDPKR